MFRNLIFDWSGTLVDDMGPVLEATNGVFAHYGIPALSREEFRRHFRLPYTEFYQEFLPTVPLGEIEDQFRKHFDASTARVFVLPHAREKLEWCAANGIRAFVLSSMDAIAFERQLAEFGLQAYFEATYAGVLDKRDMIHHLLERHGLLASETAFVGDMTHDVETARHGGVSSVAVLTGYTHPEPLAAVRPDLTVPDLDVLKRLLDRQVTKPRPIATVGAVLVREDGRVLMIRTHKWSDRWGIPGGKIERGETSEDALRREVREETGLVVDSLTFVMVQDCIWSEEFERREHFLLLNYLAKVGEGEVCLNDEAEEFRWVTVEDAFALPLNQPTRILLEECLDRRLLTLS